MLDEHRFNGQGPREFHQGSQAGWYGRKRHVGRPLSVEFFTQFLALHLFWHWRFA